MASGIAIFIGLFLVLATLLIFLGKKTTHLKFMYPGLVTFLLFMIIPIIFSIYVSFTNLSTGHFFSEDEALGLIKEEKFLPTNAEIYPFQLGCQDKICEISTAQLLGSFELGQEGEVVLKNSDHDINRPLTRGQVFKHLEDLKKLTFVLPSGLKLYFYRSLKLAPLKNRYDIQDNKIIDIVSGEEFSIDREKGFFTSQATGKNLAPGFYTNIGLGNYLSIFKNEGIKSTFLKVLIWTLAWGFFSVALSFSAGMFLALFLNDKNLKLKPVYRSLLIIPYSIPFFISVLIFKGMFNQDFGIINQFVQTIGLSKVAWLENPSMAKISALIVNLWLGFPYMFLVITGILQSIPESVYEAAKLDGASAWMSFRRITLPLIMSSIAPLLIGSFAFNLNNFVGIYLLTGGGPPMPGALTPVGETDILISYTYRLAFEGGQGQDFGLASTISIFIFVIISILTLINFKMTNMAKEGER